MKSKKARSESEIRMPDFYEILAVVVISILVLCLLRAGYRQVRAVSVRKSCMENVKKIGTALQMYADDWGGYAPPYTTTNFKRLTIGTGNTPQVVNLYGFSNVPRLKRCFAPYGAGHIWHCPLDPVRSPWARRTHPPVDHSQTSYYVDARVAILRPVSIFRPPVVPADKWRNSFTRENIPTRWCATDDVTQGGPYYMECPSPHGLRTGKLILKFDGSVFFLPKGRG